MVEDLDQEIKTLQLLHDTYLEGTEKQAIVPVKTMFLCNLTFAVSRGIPVSSHRVYATSKAIKHLYDKRTTLVYDFLINKIHLVVKYPDYVYQNKPGKKGDYAFVKKIGSTKLLVTIEEKTTEEGTELYVVTSFPTKENYLKDCPLIWSWRGGGSSS